MQSMSVILLFIALLLHQRVDGALWNETYPKGQVVRPGDFDIYTVGNSSRGIAMVVFYDIYGFNISQTRVFCDRLASEYSIQVVMPDTFRGTARPTDGNTSAWSAMVGNWSRVSNDLIYVTNWLRNIYSINQIGVTGFCWGGLQVVRACSNLSNIFFTGISIHGSQITPAEVRQLQKPMLFIAASNDPDLQPNISDAIDQSNPGISKLCEYKKYLDVNHGFVAAGANYSNPVNVIAIDDVHARVTNFLTKILNNNSVTTSTNSVTIPNNSVTISIDFFILLTLVCFSFHLYL